MPALQKRGLQQSVSVQQRLPVRAFTRLRQQARQANGAARAVVVRIAVQNGLDRAGQPVLTL